MFGYVGNVVCNSQGVPDKQRMRCDTALHPGHAPYRPFDCWVVHGEESKSLVELATNGIREVAHEAWCCARNQILYPIKATV